MAYDAAQLSPVIIAIGGWLPGEWSYVTSDDLATVTASGYFTGSPADKMQVGDAIVIQDEADTQRYYIIVTAITPSITTKVGAAQQAADEAEAFAAAAEASALVAEGQAELAGQYAADAELAADQAQNAAGIFADTTEGIAGTTNGEFFSVVGDGDAPAVYTELYRNESGVAVYQGRNYPSLYAVELATNEAAVSLIQVAQGISPVAPTSTLTSETSRRVDVVLDGDPLSIRRTTVNKTDIGGLDTDAQVERFAFKAVVDAGVWTQEGPGVLYFEDKGFIQASEPFRIVSSAGALLFGGYPDTEKVTLKADGVVPDGGLWRWPMGQLMQSTPDPTLAGMPAYIDTVNPSLSITEVPEYSFVASGHTPRVFQIGPSAQYIPGVAPGEGRLLAAWGGDTTNPEEANTNFIIVAYSDDQAGGWPEGSWVECAYIQMPSVNYRTLDPRMWDDGSGKVPWILFSITEEEFGAHDFRYGCWAAPITNPLGTYPTFGEMLRFRSYGFPGKPVRYGEKWMINIDLRETGNSPLPDYMGKWIAQWSPETRSAPNIAKIANDSLAITSWPEASMAQLRDGTLICAYRTTEGAYISFGTNGGTSWTAGVLWTALGTNPESRCAVMTTANGNLVIGYNNSATRENMTIAIWEAPTIDGGFDEATAPDQSYLLSGGISPQECSYPDLTEDDEHNIILTCDNVRAPGKIIGWVINEAGLLAGSLPPDPTPFVISDMN